MRSRVAALVVLSVAAAAGAMGARQARDPGGVGAPTVAAPSGTAVLSGQLIVDTTSPRPIRRAVVRVSGTAGTSARLMGTDDDGHFEFTALSAGRITLSATKPGYVPAFYESKHPGCGPGVPIAIGDGQRVAVTLKMLPGAVITGTVTDSRGTRAPGVPITAVELHSAACTTALPARATTDDRGVYRLFGLAPGDYVVAAMPRLTTGRAGDPTAEVLGVTDAEVQWARSLSAMGTASAGPSVGSAMPGVGRPVTYAPVFYPGTTDARAAAPVSVTAGQERADVGFPLQLVTTARIAGTFVDPSGQPVEASASLYPRQSSQSPMVDLIVTSGVLLLPRGPASASTFSIPGVTPGEYTLVARSGSNGRDAAPPPLVLWNVTDVTVTGQDQTNLVVRLQPGVTISGSISFEHASLAPPADMSRLDVSMASATTSFIGAPGSRAVIDENGAFRFSNVAPGSYTLKTTAPPVSAGGHWTLKSALQNGHDWADMPLEVKPGGDIAGVVITFTDHESAISGTFVDAGGVPITRYSIVVFTTDRSLWLPNARRIRSVSPATDGTFSVTGLPAGDYAIAAAEDVEASDLADPAFLSTLLASSYRVTLRDGERMTQNLRVGG